jgi:acetyl-CoA C-acetyltransferase
MSARHGRSQGSGQPREGRSKEVGHLCLGNVIHTEPKDMYISRVAAINAGLPYTTAALTVNRLCGSGMQAIVSAAQSILLGDTDVAIGAGAESMSRSGYLDQSIRWGARMGDSKQIDMMVGALTDPFDAIHMGVTAENIAKQWNLTREEQDSYAVQSQQRAAAAIAAGNFKSHLVPIELKSRKGPTQFDTDEHVKGDTTMESLAKLRAAFVKENGTVTAGNASGLNDGAAAVVLMEAGAAAKQGIDDGEDAVYGHAGVDSKIMASDPSRQAN